MKNVILTYKVKFDNEVPDDDAINSTLEIFRQDRHFPDDDDIQIIPLEPPFALDKWDVQVIQYLKKTPIPVIDELIKIWAKRNSIDLKDVKIEFILSRLLEICSKLNLITFEKLWEETSPANYWKNLFTKDGFPNH